MLQPPHPAQPHGSARYVEEECGRSETRDRKAERRGRTGGCEEQKSHQRQRRVQSKQHHVLLRVPHSLFCVLLAVLHASTALAWSNGAALKPPMGWANWNNFGCNYTEDLLHEMADAFVSSGLAGAGNPWDGVRAPAP